MPRFKYSIVGAVHLLCFCAPLLAQKGSGVVYHVDCGLPEHVVGKATVLHSLQELNNIVLHVDDSVLFRRGTVCDGSLEPKGNGFNIGAYGTGKLPRIEAGAKDEAAFLLSNQEHITVSSLELVGGTIYGVHVTGTKSAMHSITLRNLTVRDVNGPLRKKASGLVVIGPESPSATFDDVLLDGVRAYDTTQWAGIFVAGGSLEKPATNVVIRNSVVHDVQGDGIVLFNARDSSVSHSVAWHTGMQHQQSIGTPNGIWTWQCTHCTVTESEAFLTDSPGVDGGAFDIDWGNTDNTVQKNYGHDTQGYCVSVFGANGPTSGSLIDGNVCINNGQSPRLAQREGAILLMTWNGGSIHGLTISNNVVDWHPAGNTPAIQAGSHLTASDIRLSGNRLLTEAVPAIDPNIPYQRNPDRTDLIGDGSPHPSAAGAFPLRSKDKAPNVQIKRLWRLVAAYPASLDSAHNNLGDLLVDLTSISGQYAPTRLGIEIQASARTADAVADWDLFAKGVTLRSRPMSSAFSIELISPSGRVIHRWNRVPSLVELGAELRRSVGPPDFARLSFVSIPATD